MKPSRHCLRIGICAALLYGASVAAAQQAYNSYYQQHNAGRAGTAATAPTRYLYNKYYYHRPTVSPYMNLNRRDPLGATAYQAYVRPEQQRRSQAGLSPSTRSAAPRQSMPSAYYNQWYAGRGQR